MDSNRLNVLDNSSTLYNIRSGISCDNVKNSFQADKIPFTNHNTMDT